jgi:hypothetical protein
MLYRKEIKINSLANGRARRKGRGSTAARFIKIGDGHEASLVIERHENPPVVLTLELVQTRPVKRKMLRDEERDLYFGPVSLPFQSGITEESAPAPRRQLSVNDEAPDPVARQLRDHVMIRFTGSETAINSQLAIGVEARRELRFKLVLYADEGDGSSQLIKT